jgi:hypothetical protein
MIFSTTVAQLTRISIFLKFNVNNICIDSFNDHTSHLKISEQIIN